MPRRKDTSTTMRTKGSVIENLDTEVHYEQKPPCKCGCKDIKSAWDASVPASPEFVRELNEEINVLLEKAKQVRINGRSGYYEFSARLMAGRLRILYLYVVDLYLLQRLLRPFT